MTDDSKKKQEKRLGIWGFFFAQREREKESIFIEEEDPCSLYSFFVFLSWEEVKGDWVWLLDGGDSFLRCRGERRGQKRTSMLYFSTHNTGS